MSSGLLRSALFYAGVSLAAYLSFLMGRLAGAVVVLCMLSLALLARGVLPRTGHRSFRQGNYQRARWVYALLARLRLHPRARLAAISSCAACEIALGNYDAALAKLALHDEEHLDDVVRCAWRNNRAYALARLGRDPEQALRDATLAVESRPEVAGFRHTRGVVLIALGRIDAAIRELDNVWRTGTEATPLLEAERCYDLGAAWMLKGEREYALDYFERCWRAAPTSSWAERARTKVKGRDYAGKLAELV